MEEKLRIGDRACAVSARETGPGRLRVEVDGAAFDVEVVASSGGSHLVRLGSALEEIVVARAAEGVWVWHRGRARLVARAPAERRAAPSSGAAPGRVPGLPPGAVTPPMPSVVVAVLVAEGQRVARGDPLVVVSAMKTESQLLAPAAGRVASVRIAVGAKVRPGEILVQVDPEEASHGG